MSLEEGSFQATVFVAVIFAGIARTLIPYLSKRQEDIQSGLKPRPFTFSYVITAVLGTVPVLIGSILLLPIVLPQISNTGTQLMVFITAFGLAYATTDVVNRNLPSMGTVTPALVKKITEEIAAKDE